MFASQNFHWQIEALHCSGMFILLKTLDLSMSVEFWICLEMPRVLQMVFCKYSKDFNYLFGNFSSHDQILTISSLFEVGRWFHCCCLVSEMLRLRLIATGVKSANSKREVFLFGHVEEYFVVVVLLDKNVDFENVLSRI